MNTDISFRLSDDDVLYLETWMNRVSRSFAVVVAVLEEPLKCYLSAAYIICRVVDNIEDSSSPVEAKKARFGEISEILSKPELAEDILVSWDAEPWDGLTADEKNLMLSENERPLWRIFSRFPIKVKRAIEYWVGQMIHGMAHLTDAASSPRFVTYNSINILAGYQDYSQYCYIVAGTVGNLATDLVKLHYKLTDYAAGQLLKYSQACGRGLQKTNIIKDFCDDVSRGVCYLPDEWLREVKYTPLFLKGAPRDWSIKVLSDVMAELKDATNYILALPYEALSYRISSLLCLLPALQTILLACQNQSSLFTAQHAAKIDHRTFGLCIQDSQRLAANNQGILDYYQQVEVLANAAIMENCPRPGIKLG